MDRIIFCFLVLCFFFACKPEKHDTLIRNGLIYDGMGGEPLEGDIAIDGDRITAIGRLGDRHAAEREIDARGLAVVPGFIDLHAHLEPLMDMPDAESHVRQGVTTALGGPDGSAPWPLRAYCDSLEQMGLGMNVAYLAGHNTVRRNVMGLDNRAPTPAEMEEMKAQIRQCMEDGAFGMSTGLKYLPGAFSKVDEVIELSKVAAQMGGFYTSHLREEGLGLIEAVREAIQIGAEAKIPVVLTHHKTVGKPMWGKSRLTLALVDSARAAGLDIMIDQYPYAASYTGISVLIPAWAMAGGQDAFAVRVADPALRDSIRSGIIFNILNDRGGADLKRVQFAQVGWQKDLEGRTLYDWAVQKGLAPSMETGADLVIEAQLKGGASCVFFAMADEDVERIMQHSQTMIASDGRLVRPGQGHPHPRWYGTFPNVLGHYVREKNTLTLPQAIHKMTAMPARRMGLEDRGVLAVGKKADVVLFDPQIIADKATFENPHQYPQGVLYVIVNGVVTVDNGKFTDRRGGRVLYKGRPDLRSDTR